MSNLEHRSRLELNRQNSMEATLQKYLTEVAQKTEESILEQLNFLISRGLIEVKSGPPKFVHDYISNKVEIKHNCELVLKDQEYILSLERQIAELQALVKTLRDK